MSGNWQIMFLGLIHICMRKFMFVTVFSNMAKVSQEKHAKYQKNSERSSKFKQS